MNMWCHLPTSFKRRHLLHFVVLAAIIVALITTLLFAHAAQAIQSTNKTINFQGRLLTSTGAVVADGHYNIQFKIYQDGTGTSAGNPDGTLKWTESYVNNGGSNGVEVKNGFFSVSLGSLNPFGTSVDWNQDTLFLSMNIAGNAATCTTFGTSPCSADGEMLPMKRITATPYAINSGAVGGKTADNFVQLGQGVQTDASVNTSSIFLNKTGTGNLVQLQNTAKDVFTVTNTGDLQLGSDTNHTIAVTTAAANTAGGKLTLAGGVGGSNSVGGDLILQGGAAGSASSNGTDGPNALASENFEGQPNGTPITSSNTIFDTIFSNGSANFSNEWSIDGSLSAKYVTQANALKKFTSTNKIASRWYMMLPNLPVNNTSLGQASLSGTTLAQLSLFTDGTVRLRNGGTADGVATSALPTNTAIRVEWKIDSVAHTQEARFYWGQNLHGTTPNTTTLSSNYTGGNFDTLSTSVNIAATGFTMYVDKWAYGTDWIGPLQYVAGNGGNVQLDAGAKAGVGSGGSIFIGATNANVISIGSTSSSLTQSIAIGANNTAGSVSNVTIGAGGAAAGGTTTVQAKNSVIIKTNDTTRATFSDTTNTVYFGNGVSATAPSDSTLQGTNSSAAAVAGGSLTVQGGNATVGNANGGNIILTGGTGSGSGANGLVVLKTPTFSTVTNDANCYTNGAAVAANCTITASTVNNSAAVVVGLSAAGHTATLPDPTITTAGRILYITAANGSQDFTLRANAGEGSDIEQNITMHQNTTTTMLWNGSNWTAAGGSNSTTLQDAYNNTPQSATGSDVVVSGNGSGTGGLTVQNSSTNPVGGPLLSVKNAANASLFSVTSSDGLTYATDGGVHDSANFASNWPTVGSTTATRITSAGQEGGDSAQVTAADTSVGGGISNKLSINPLASTRYRVTVYAKLVAGSAFDDFKVRYSPDGGTTFVDCTTYNTQSVATTDWTQITCYIDTTTTAVTSPYIYFVQPTAPASARTYLIDNFALALASNSAPSVKIGNGAGGDQTTLFTVDKAASAPTAADSNALLGSMYYDTTLGKLQCFEAAGWGSCGSSPDDFETLSPQYTNSVTHGTDIGTLSTDLCSDALNINDGTSGQPSICSSNETYNFYKWTSAETTAQTKSIYVTYQLPSSFKEFVAGSTSLMGRTDTTDATVSYQVYRNNSSTGLTPCGSTMSVSTGPQTTWQKVVAAGAADPSACGFAPGDNIVFKINLITANNANAYASNLAFIFSNH